MSYVSAFILSILAFLSYELAIVIPLLLIVIDLMLKKPKNKLSTYLIHIPFISLVPIYFLIRHATHTFSGGGDYSYNLRLLIPNIFGNIFGYIGLFFAGETFLPIYNMLRSNLGENIPLFAAIFIFVFAAAVFIILKYKHKISHTLSANRIIIFLILFAVISLLPYLALGNIALRYLYLASAGFSIAFVLILVNLAAKSKYATVFLLIAILIMYYPMIRASNNQWEKAGEITRNMLTDFRLRYENLQPTDYLYFLNVPMKYGNAWVYPVGLPDSLWFIYRENTPVILQVGSVEEAKAKTQKFKKNYLINLDGKGHIEKTEL